MSEITSKKPESLARFRCIALTRAEMNILWDSLTGRYTESLRAGDDEKAKQYYTLRKKIEDNLEKIVKLEKVM